MLTAEERRVPIYSGCPTPTISSNVTEETDLESLNLNWTEKDLPEQERTKHVHRLHPYLGKFVPQIVEIFIRKYFKPGQTILDPFCGSGTSLVQANELGVNSIGCDVSAFNVLLCQAKTSFYDLNEVQEEILDILEKTRFYVDQTKNSFGCGPQQLNLLDVHQTINIQADTDNEYLKLWFAPLALHELLAYRNFISSGSYKYQTLLKIILSRSARSARLTTHFDLDFPQKPQIEPYWCYKHSRTCSPTDAAFKFIKRYSLDTLKRIKEFSPKQTSASVDVFHADSRETVFPQIHGVITSPPYVGLIDYHEQHAYAYNLFGLEDKRCKEIGAAAGGSSQKAKRQYQEDIAEVFQRISDSMICGGRFIVIAGDRANLYPKIAELAGLEMESVVQRHVNRRTGRRSSEFYESVFIWRKP